MDPVIGAALIGTAGSLAGGLLSGASSKSAAKAQYRYNMQLLQYQNAYNAPAAQMERLKEAGLNPMLVYGNGSVVGNTSGSGHGVSVTPADYSGVGRSAGQAAEMLYKRAKMNQDVQLGQAQVDQVKANTAAVAASILNTEAATKKLNAETDSVLYNLGIARRYGTRDSALNIPEVGRSYFERTKGVIDDVINGHSSGKNSIVDQLRRLFR